MTLIILFPCLEYPTFQIKLQSSCNDMKIHNLFTPEAQTTSFTMTRSPHGFYKGLKNKSLKVINKFAMSYHDELAMLPLVQAICILISGPDLLFTHHVLVTLPA